MTQCALTIEVFDNLDSDEQSKRSLVQHAALHGIELVFCDKAHLNLHFKQNKIYLGHDGSYATLQWIKDYQLHLKKRYNIKSEPLAQSLGVHKNVVDIMDLTLGTGKDALLLLSFGVSVKCFERNPMVFILCLSEYLHLINFDSSLSQRFEISFGEGLDQVTKESTVYYDPMYPEKKKKALARKEMEIFKNVVGPDDDSVDYVQKLVKYAKRVVVKRANKNPPLLAKPLTFKGKTTSYDRYGL